MVKKLNREMELAMPDMKTKPPPTAATKEGTAASDPSTLTHYTTSVILNMAEVQILLQIIGSVPLQGTAEQLEGVLPIYRSLKSKLLQAAQAISREMSISS